MKGGQDEASRNEGAIVFTRDNKGDRRIDRYYSNQWLHISP